MVDLYEGDVQEVLRWYPDDCFSSVVTDPPYEWGQDKWDSTGVSFREDTWAEIYRVLKPGGYLISFGGDRTYHRIAKAIEDAHFEIKRMLVWIYAQGSPKQGDQLKPAVEPLCLAQKPGEGHLNIQACRFPVRGKPKPTFPTGDYSTDSVVGKIRPVKRTADSDPNTRYPSNVMISDDELLGDRACYFFCAKPSAKERGKMKHKTLKPLALMKQLVKLVTPEDGTVLDPFMGTGTTGIAALHCGFDFVGIDLKHSSFMEARERFIREFEEDPMERVKSLLTNEKTTRGQ